MFREKPIERAQTQKGRISESETTFILNHVIPKYILKRTVKEGHFATTEDARIAGIELMKYIVLCLENPNVRIGMWSEDIDEIWHTYVLHTREYFAFSRDVLGVDYFHHTPLIISDNGESNMPQDGGANFIRLYNEKFGDLPSIWGSMNETKNHCGPDECCCY
jgi:hypothetical protein